MDTRDWNQTAASACLRTGWAGRELHFKEVTDSTFADADRLAAAGAPHGTVAAADRQEAGRGRRGRDWSSPAGENIYFTILLRPDWEPEQLPLLTLTMALAAARAVREVTGQPALIKWPNDVVIRGKKIVGILTELKELPPARISAGTEEGGRAGTDGHQRFVMIGTGVNVNQKEFPEPLRQKATSLYLETGGRTDRSALFAALLQHFEEAYERLEADGGFAGLRPAYEALLANRDSHVRVLDPQGEYEGTARGITDRGELLVERQDGSVTEVYAGEVSVRGIYGYV